MSSSVFARPEFELRGAWAGALDILTPITAEGEVRFKREDSFAPLGYGAINGAKLRQCIWLVNEYVRSSPKPTGIISGASVKSPQLSMGTAVAKHFGLESLLVIGATAQHSATKHENVAIAAWMGAKFVITPVAYNPVLQGKVAELKAQMPDRFVLEYGITVSDSDARIEAFHRVGSEQVRNFPDDVEHLFMPAGSCNSCTSVLYGIARFRPKALKRITLFGIGPLRLEWIEERLAAIERVTGLSIRGLFSREYAHHPKLAEAHAPKDSAPYHLRHYDLHTTKFASYQDEMPYTLGGIDFHPTYEGKVMTYLKQREREFPEFWGSGRALFWIVGSKPTMAKMHPPLRHVYGDRVPGLLPLWEGARVA